jgi:hypothetical protein
MQGSLCGDANRGYRLLRFDNREHFPNAKTVLADKKDVQENPGCQ